MYSIELTAEEMKIAIAALKARKNQLHAKGKDAEAEKYETMQNKMEHIEVYGQ